MSAAPSSPPAVGAPVVALPTPEDRTVRRHAERHVDRLAAPAPATHALFVPVLLLALAVVGWSGFQCYELLREHAQLVAAYDAQQPEVDAALRVRANLDALAASTQRLANAGNADARAVVDALRRRGVSINPNPAPPSGAR